MTDDDRDLVIARALEQVEVPDYDPAFWDRLDARLERGAAPTARVTPGPAPAGLPPADGASDVVPLVPARRAHRPRSARVLAVAAAIALAVVLTWQVRPDGDEVRTAAPTQATSTTSDPAGTTAIRPGSTAERDVVAWLEAVGAGDVEAALALTGPRTIAYYDALGADIRGVLAESGEGYGGWVDSPDRTTALVPLGEVQGQAVAAVVLAGTWSGEGEDGYRVQAIPVVQAAGGDAWLVEPAAFDPSSEGKLIILSPPPGPDGLGGLPSDGVIEVSGDRGGAYWFSIDGAAPTRVDAPGGEDVVRFDPDDGALTSDTHLLVVAQVDERNITAEAHTFTVEG